MFENLLLNLHIIAKEEDGGKYMVRATNAGGEAQSIADIAIFDPRPDTMMEVHKTVVYESVQDKNVVQVIYFLKQTFDFFFFKEIKEIKE